jgi:hypothetical protein
VSYRPWIGKVHGSYIPLLRHFNFPRRGGGSGVGRCDCRQLANASVDHLGDRKKTKEHPGICKVGRGIPEHEDIQDQQGRDKMIRGLCKKP